MHTCLITGGAGYIGSHFAHYMARLGKEVVILDDLSLGHKQAAAGLPLVVGSTVNPAILDKVFKQYNIGAVVHFAAYSKVGESVLHPGMYYQNNVCGGLELMKAMIRHGVDNLVFSSTCAVYGEPVSVPITEEHPQKPINPYGMSKLVFERMAMDLSRASSLRPVFLRYFNAAGADPEGELGEDHHPETHLIPITINAALGRLESVSIFGDDYDTEDGTCVRDYIHVTDLASAHLKALEYLNSGGEPDAFNLGTGGGYSVRQVIDAVCKVTGLPVKAVPSPRRPGDPSTLVSSNEKAVKTLGWTPELSGIDNIIGAAFDWMKAHPDGYGKQ